MAEFEKRLFRPEALDRLSSPDNLERLMPVTRAWDWLLIAVTGTLLVLFVGWAIAGTVPTTADGRGVILRPSEVMQAQTSAAGRILTLRVKAGDQITEGALVATIDQTDIFKRIEENQGSIQALEEQDRTRTAAAERQVSLQKQQDELERSGLSSQKATLTRSLADSTSLRPILERRADANRKMVKEGLLGFAAKDIVDDESAIRDNEAKFQDYTSRLGQIDGQLQQIETRSATLAKQVLDEAMARRNEIEQIRKSISLDEFQTRRDGNIYSQYSGRVAEVMAAVGEVMPAGGRLLTIEAEKADAGLVSISYFPVRDGKKIHPGMRLQITPDTVERERFGGILGTVFAVSPIPVTKEGVTGTIGNQELVQSLMPGGAFIEVRARLEADPATASGYRWSSSRGPDMKVTSGLTHTTRVTIEQRAPVTYLLPVLREISGVYQ
jgi:HlyD family secretion protein